MLRLLRYLWTGDSHICRFTIEREAKELIATNSKDLLGYMYVKECPECGRIKSQKVTCN